MTHKTFHRYTVRAKHGTAQGLRDARGGASRSAGANLRRYNEATLYKVSQASQTWWATHAHFPLQSLNVTIRRLIPVPFHSLRFLGR